MKKFLLLVFVSSMFFSCDENENNDNTFQDDFDRQLMLTNWADNIITPAYQQFENSLVTLNQNIQLFLNEPSELSLDIASDSWLDSYLKWQYVEMFDFGYAEVINYKNKMNVYPADSQFIDENIENSVSDLNNNSYNDARGFPAIDYLIHGLSDDKSTIVQIYLDNQKHSDYLQAVITNMLYNTELVVDDWNNSKDDFIQSTGNTSTSSINKLTNDFIFYFEKGFRENKFGIPAGIYSSSPLPNNVEAFYKKDVSKQLALEALNACQGFFNGVSLLTGMEGSSLNSYLETLPGSSNNSLISDILSQFDEAKSQIEILDDNFYNQIETNNIQMLYAFDAIQLLVVYFKVDMLQSLAISVDYVDADGD